MIDTKMTLELQKNGVQKTVYHKAYESTGVRKLYITLSNDGKVFDLEGYTFVAYMNNGTTTTALDTYSGNNYVTVDDNTIILAVPSRPAGTVYIEIAVQQNGEVLYTPRFALIAEASLASSGSGTYETGESYVAIGGSSFYTEAEVDALLDGKADVGDSYTIAETNTLFATKQDTLTAGTNITITNNVISAASDDDVRKVYLNSAATGVFSDAELTDPLTANEIADIVRSGKFLDVVLPVGDYQTHSPVVDINDMTINPDTSEDYVILFTVDYSTDMQSYTLYKYVIDNDGNCERSFVRGSVTGSGGGGGGTYIIDTYPTEGSENLVTSGGVYTAVNNAYTKTETDTLLSNMQSTLNSAISAKQNPVVSGRNIEITSNPNNTSTIALTGFDQAVTDGSGNLVTSGTIYNAISDMYTKSEVNTLIGNVETDVEGKQDALVAGSNITLTDNGDNTVTIAAEVRDADAYPINGSTNVVESNGIYDAIQTAKTEAIESAVEQSGVAELVLSVTPSASNDRSFVFSMRYTATTIAPVLAMGRALFNGGTVASFRRLAVSSGMVADEDGYITLDTYNGTPLVKYHPLSTIGNDAYWKIYDINGNEIYTFDEVAPNTMPRIYELTVDEKNIQKRYIIGFESASSAEAYGTYVLTADKDGVPEIVDTNYQKKLIAGANINIAEDGVTISASAGEIFTPVELIHSITAVEQNVLYEAVFNISPTDAVNALAAHRLTFNGATVENGVLRGTITNELGAEYDYDGGTITIPQGSSKFEMSVKSYTGTAYGNQVVYVDGGTGEADTILYTSGGLAAIGESCYAVFISPDPVEIDDVTYYSGYFFDYSRLISAEVTQTQIETYLVQLEAEIDDKADASDVYTKAESNSMLADKQNTLTAGTNITISNDVISAEEYTLPTATTSVLGGVKVDGDTITINDGVISSASEVVWAEMGVTTFEEISAYITAGKAVYVLHNNRVYTYEGIISTTHHFESIAHTGSIIFYNYLDVVSVSGNTQWSSSSYTLLDTSRLKNSSSSATSTDNNVYTALATDNLLSAKENTNRKVSSTTGIDNTSTDTQYPSAKAVYDFVNASAYTLPTASTSTLGGVKVDGDTITIADGVISADIPTAVSDLTNDSGYQTATEVQALIDASIGDIDTLIGTGVIE